MSPMLHIRKHVFRIPQTEMAEIAGVSQGTVSKWETGSLAPDRDAMQAIRDEAFSRSLEWDDRWFFEEAAQ